MSKIKLVVLGCALVLGLAGIAGAADSASDPATEAFLASLAAPEVPEAGQGLPETMPEPLFRADCGPDFCLDVDCSSTCSGCPYTVICNYTYCSERCRCDFSTCCT